MNAGNEGMMQVLRDVLARHNERMATDPKYRETYARMKAATETKPVDQPGHYDRDGYCDNPARGY